jgi:LuxR family maltose regulon positive regulatory protein
MRPPLEQSCRRHDLIRLLVVESLAHLDLFELDHAVEALGAALDIGEAGPYQRVFLEEGEPMIRLLKLAHRRGQNPLYIGELLEAAGHAPVRITRVKHQDLVEPISSREIEVLRLIAHGLTNREISEELYLSTGTVKRHITNLYGKLGVSSRTDAVQQARKLGLLSHEKVTVRRLTRQVPVR